MQADLGRPWKTWNEPGLGPSMRTEDPPTTVSQGLPLTLILQSSCPLTPRTNGQDTAGWSVHSPAPDLECPKAMGTAEFCFCHW